jgi:ribosomal protein S18 acetylase RimI-like enzyme
MRKKYASIHEAKVNDYSMCLPLFETLYHGDIGPDFKQTFESYVNNEDGVVLLAEHSNRTIGILVGSYHLDIDWEGRTAKVDALIVDESYRKKGIGKRLVQHFIAIARRKQCKAIKSRINRRNVVAQKFHRSLGFTEAGTYEYFQDFGENAEKN